MARINIPIELIVARKKDDPAKCRKLINATQSTWHAAFPGGAGPISVTTGFSTPSSVECDRIPELALTAGGTPGAYVITGTWNSAAQTETITTVAGSTVKGTKPFDTITSFAGPDPGVAKNVTLYMGDSYTDPPARALYTGTAAGNVSCKLTEESAVQTQAVPKERVMPWEITRVTCTTTTLTAAYLWW